MAGRKYETRPNPECLQYEVERKSWAKSASDMLTKATANRHYAPSSATKEGMLFEELHAHLAELVHLSGLVSVQVRDHIGILRTTHMATSPCDLVMDFGRGCTFTCVGKRTSNEVSMEAQRRDEVLIRWFVPTSREGVKD